MMLMIDLILVRFSQKLLRDSLLLLSLADGRASMKKHVRVHDVYEDTRMNNI